MKKRIVSIVLVVLVIGLIFPGCVPKTQLDECRTLMAEQAAQIEERDAQIDELEAQRVALNSTIEAKDARIAELEAELAKVPKAPENPSYEELMDFLAKDQTDQKEWRYKDYTAANFALDLRHNAKEEGIRAALVILLHPGHVFHFLNCFETTNRDLVFIEPQLDFEVTVELGRSYSMQNEKLRPNKRYNDEIYQVIFVWEP